MSDSSPGPSQSILLVSEARKRDSQLCIICQRKKDAQSSTKLTSTPDGRRVIIQTSQLLQDELLIGLSDTERLQMKYHVKSCYARYKRIGARQTQKETPAKRDAATLSPPTTPVNRQKRAKTIVTPNSRDKPCIICD